MKCCIIPLKVCVLGWSYSIVSTLKEGSTPTCTHCTDTYERYQQSIHPQQHRITMYYCSGIVSLTTPTSTMEGNGCGQRDLAQVVAHSLFADLITAVMLPSTPCSQVLSSSDHTAVVFSWLPHRLSSAGLRKATISPESQRGSGFLQFKLAIICTPISHCPSSCTCPFGPCT